MSYYCQYKIIRFTPFVETEEFANIGVVVYCPSTGLVSFKLAPSRFGRITQFFKGMDAQVYTLAIKNLDSELSYLRNVLKERQTSEIGNQVFE